MSDGSEPAKKPIGEEGEDFVEWACHAPFGKDFLFRGQKYMDTKGEIELCDLLLLLDDTAVLMEVKTADREKWPDRTNEEWADWANTQIAWASTGSSRRSVTAGWVRCTRPGRRTRRGRWRSS